MMFIFQIIYTVCERLLELAKKGSSLRRQFEKNSKPPLAMNNLQKTFSNLSQTSSSGSKTPVQQSSSKDLLTNGKRRYKRSLLSARARTKSISMEDLTDEKFLSVLDDEESVSSSNSGLQMKTPGASDEEDDDDSIIFGNSTVDLKSSVASSTGTNSRAKSNGQSNERSGSPGSENTSVSGTANWSIDQSLMTADMSEDHVQAVGVALSSTKIEDYVKDRARDLQVSKSCFHTFKQQVYLNNRFKCCLVDLKLASLSYSSHYQGFFFFYFWFSSIKSLYILA